MASVYRPIYSKIDPKTGKRVKRKLSKWYIKYRTPDGRIHRVPGYTDREATKQLAARKEREAARKIEGMVNPFEGHHKRTLADHLDDFETALRSATNKRGNKNTENHVKLTVHRAQRIMNGCRFLSIADICADKVEAFITRLGTDENLSIQSQNYYLAAAKQFCRWLVDHERMDRNPLARLKCGNVALDRRHDRRALPPSELQKLFEAAKASQVIFRGLAGVDRLMLYGTAIGTGLRVSELASLHPASFRLKSGLPVVHVEAGDSKNRQPVTQPLPLELANALRDYLASKPADQPVWPGTWPEKASKMIRLDLEACGIAYRDESGLVADFHSLRHCYVALLDRAGVSLKQAMQLARHSDPKLTMARYGRAHLHDLTTAVEKLPFFSPPKNHRQAIAAVGTDPAAHVPRHCPAGEISRVSLITEETGEPPNGDEEHFTKTLQTKASETGCDQLTTADSGLRPEGLEPPTYGLEIRCSIQLSYGRTCLKLWIFLISPEY